MSTANPPPLATPEIRETDKPFILVMVGTGAVIGIAAYSIITGKWADAKDFITEFMVLVSAGWAYYFRSKS